MSDVLKRALQCALVVVLVLGLTPLAAFADEVEEAVSKTGDPSLDAGLEPAETEVVPETDAAVDDGDGDAEDGAVEAEIDPASAEGAEEVATALLDDLEMLPLAVAREAASSFDNLESAPSSAFGLSVGWDDPVCETPTVFTVQAPGATAKRQYRLDSVDRYQTKQQYIEWVMDPSKFVYQDSPEFEVTFYASGLYKLRFSALDLGVTPAVREWMDVWVTIDDPTHPSPEVIADRVAAECLAAGNNTDFDKALWLHDWVIDNMEYDHTLRFCGAEGAFARGIGTCESYHRAYVMLLERVGIPTGRITGNGHVWTAVKIDGEWCQVDATWDDTTQFAGYPDLRHMYFGLNDSIMGLVHPDHKAPVAGYESNSLENNYFIREGDISDWFDPIVSTILDKLNKKETSFTVEAANAGWAAKNFKNVINNLVAYELNQCEWITDNQTAEAVVHVSYADDYFTVNVFTVLASEPKIAQNLVYNGKTQTGVTVPSTGSYALTGMTKATKAGTYTAQVVPGTGYAWDKLGDKKSRSYRWTIAPASIGSRGVAVSGVQSSYRYTGSAVKPVPRLTFNGTALTNGTDYTVSYANNVNAGTATMTITGKGNFQGTRKVAFSIEKATTPTIPSQPPATSKPSDKPSSVTKPSVPTVTKPTAAWKKSGGKWWYRHADGSCTRNGWERINGAWYHFDGAGWMQTGWLKTGGKWYYLSGSGAMKTGWLKSGGSWYYLKSSGAMATGWYKVGGAWYWSNSSGVMGSNRWVGSYYLKSSGAMATNQWIGKYHVNGSGLWDRTR